MRPGGNNRKYYVTTETLQSFVDQGYSNKYIGYKLDLKPGVIRYLLWKRRIKRKYDHLTEYEQYRRAVRILTEQTYKANKYRINPNDYPRTLCGVTGGYQLDHIKEIRDCFAMGLTAEECSTVDNLQIIPWQDNLEKRTYKRGCHNGHI